MKVHGKIKKLGDGRTVFLSNPHKGARKIRLHTEGQEAVWVTLSQEALNALCDLNGRRGGDPILAQMLSWMDCEKLFTPYPATPTRSLFRKWFPAP